MKAQREALMTLIKQFWIKCDGCKTVIGQTDSLHESACGGKCDGCKASDKAFLAGLNK